MVQVCVVGQYLHTEWAVLPIYEELKRQNFDVQLASLYRGDKLGDAETYLYTTQEFPSDKRNRAFFTPHSMTDEPYHGGIAAFVPGPYYASEDYIKKWNRDSGRVIQTGWAKLDSLFQGKKSQLNLPFAKTVLYAPTHNLYAVEPLVSICNRLNLNLIIKAHPYFWTGKERSGFGANVVWLPSEENITPFYHVADVLVSDISSTLREFIATDKPSIQLLTDKADKDYYGGMLHSSIEDLEATVKRALKNPDEIAEERREWRDKLFYKLDGHASERVVEALKEIMGW